MASGVRRKGLGRSLLFAIGAFILSNLGTAAVNWLSQLAVTPMQTATVATAVGLAVVFLTVVLESFKEPAPVPLGPQPVYRQSHPPQYAAPYQQPYAQPAYRPVPPPRPKSQRRVSWIVVVVVVLGLCGAGGFAVTWGVQWLNGKAICLLDPIHYDGVPRLAGPAAAKSGQLGVEVTRVAVSNCGTIVTVHAVNGGNEPLNLPVFGNASLTVPGRNTLGGDPRTSDWNGNIPAQGEMTGVLVFKKVPAAATKMTLSFAVVYGRLGGPRGISIDIPLQAVTES